MGVKDYFTLALLGINWLFRMMMYGFCAAIALLTILLLLLTIILGVTALLDTLVHLVL